jgi:hypothetical protein
MADVVAIWGAVTGSVGLGLALRREIWDNKRSLRVEHGWQYVFHTDEEGRERLIDVWVCVQAWNTGRRSLSIEHLGFGWQVEGPRELAAQVGVELGPENRVWIQNRVEIALNGETIEVIPDGPKVKVWARISGILAFGIDPRDTLLCPFVVTVPDRYWWGDERVLIPEPPVGRPVELVESGLAELAANASRSPSARRPEPGEVVGVPRLVLRGDVERSDDVFAELRGPNEAE